MSTISRLEKMSDEELLQERKDMLELANTGKDEIWREANRTLKIITAIMLKRGL